MKKFILFSIFITNLHFGSAQTWIDSNAVWHYDLEELSGLSIQGFYKYEYTEDTLIDGFLCQKIEAKVYEFYSWPTVEFLDSSIAETNYTYVSNDTVFYRNNEEFFVLFDFGASIGDTWIVSTTNNGNGFCNDTSRVEVIDTGSVIINSEFLRTITLQPLSGSSYGLAGVYNEKFGLMSYGPWHLFPRTMECDTNVIVEWYYISFKCFADDSFLLYNPSAVECEYLLTHLNIQDYSEKSIEIYPNPALEKLQIDVPENGEMKILSSSGQLILSAEIISGLDLDLEGISTGVYFIHFIGNSGATCSTTFVKF